MLDERYLYIILFLVICDIMMTMHTALLYKKKKAWNDQMELNWLPRKIINNNPSYIKGLIMIPFFFGIYYVGLYFMDRFGQDTVFGAGIFIGALLITNYIHLNNIQYYHRMKDNKKYWKDMRTHLGKA
jgi:hypothetical protein